MNIQRLHPISWAIVFFALIFMVSSPLPAGELQSPKLKQGYYLSIVPTGSLVMVDSKQNFGPWSGFGGQFRLGEELTNWFDLGLSGGLSVAYGDDYRLIHGHFGLEGTVKPTKFLWFGIVAGMGFADFSRRKTGMDEVVGRFGATYGVTAAYDFFMGKKDNPLKSGGVALSPMMGIHFGPADATSVYSLFVGVSLTWWSGLSKNKLDLPLDSAY